MRASARAEVESVWRERLSRFSQSGLSVKTFCDQESVSACSFYHWRRRMQEPATPRGTGVASFVDLGAVTSASPRIESAAAADAASLTIRLDLPGGIVVTIARG